ncbi:hypothetical protein WA026_003471 [Henosepilachna vigintioctopunctata]|uniref:HORMA domain-containing protein n=1 Tax=Henosepilachna vigintioctopunctata TaxID=420089 RepID=A0AAW1TPP3_9CUCU
MTTNKLDISDVFCEFLEVAVHNILYTRKLYPETIFIPKRKYGVVVYQSIHPEVNSYICDCMKAVNYHLRKSQLKQFFIIIQSGDHIFEKIVFDIVKMNSDIQSDIYLLELEKNIRNFCLKLNSSCSYTDSLPLDTTFIIQIATTELSSLEFNDNPAFEEFPWTHCGLNDSVIANPDIIPLQTVDIGYLNMQIFIETSSNY